MVDAVPEVAEARADPVIASGARVAVADAAARVAPVRAGSATRGPPPGTRAPAVPVGSAAVEVRPVRPDEHAALGELTVRAYDRLDGPVLDDRYAGVLRDVGGRVAAGDVVLVAVEDGALLGGVTYVRDRHSPSAEFDGDDEAGMRMLAVDPGAQGRGVGAALTGACVELAAADGRRRLVLHTTPWMAAAHRLYGRAGFARAPELDFTPVPDIPLLAYVLPLGEG